MLLCVEPTKKKTMKSFKNEKELSECNTVLGELLTFEDTFYSYIHVSQHQFDGFLSAMEEDNSNEQTSETSAQMTVGGGVVLCFIYGLNLQLV